MVCCNGIRIYKDIYFETYIKKNKPSAVQAALYISSILFPVISARISVLVLKIPDTFSK